MLDIVTQVDAPPGLRLVPYFFSVAYGTEAAGVWSAPYVLPLTSQDPQLIVSTGWQVVIATAPRTDGILRIGSIEHAGAPLTIHIDAPQTPIPTWAQPLHDVARTLSTETTPRGLDLLIHTDLPPTTGLSAKAPLACATALAWTAFHDAPTSSPTHRLDTILKNASPTPEEGALRTAVLHARPEHAVTPGPPNRPATHTPFPLAATGLRLMLITPRDPWTAPEAPTPKPTTPPAHLVDLLTQGHIESAATLLTDRHATRAIGGPQADLAATAALAEGALGARSTGPGTSAVIAIVPGRRLRAVRRAVAAAFHEQALPTPRFLTTVTAPEARREA